jgi:hypothetical protein
MEHPRGTGVDLALSKEKPMSVQKSTPAPLETGPGEQRDDNIDDLGNRPDGSREEQPVDPDRGHHPEKDRNGRDPNDRPAGK